MKRYSKKYPLWFKVKGTEVIKATLIGVRQYLREMNLAKCEVETLQKIEGVWHNVNHQYNNAEVFKDLKGDEEGCEIINPLSTVVFK